MAWSWAQVSGIEGASGAWALQPYTASQSRHSEVYIHWPIESAHSKSVPAQYTFNALTASEMIANASSKKSNRFSNIIPDPFRSLGPFGVCGSNNSCGLGSIGSQVSSLERPIRR